MIRFFSLLTFIIFAQKAFCQTTAQEISPPTPDAWQFSLFAGAAVPTGGFGSKSISDSSAGFAKVGLMGGLSITNWVSTSVGVSGMYLPFANNVDAQSMAKQANAKYPPYTWTVVADNWRANAFIVGPTARFIVEGGEVHASALIGIASATSPEMFLTGTRGGYTNTAKIASSNASAFCFAAMLGFKKDLKFNLCFLLNAGFVHTRPQFIDVNTSYTSGNGTVSNFYQDISAFTFSIGLGYRLLRKD